MSNTPDQRQTSGRPYIFCYYTSVSNKYTMSYMLYFCLPPAQSADANDARTTSSSRPTRDTLHRHSTRSHVHHQPSSANASGIFGLKIQCCCFYFRSLCWNAVSRPRLTPACTASLSVTTRRPNQDTVTPFTMYHVQISDLNYMESLVAGAHVPALWHFRR